MPTIRKKSLKIKQKLGEGQAEHLIEGVCLFEFFPFKSEDERKALYHQHREYLMQLCRDERRTVDHFFYTDRKIPKAAEDYNDTAWAQSYLDKLSSRYKA
jgi:hypothetical protein